eukprot:1104324-Pyramimonas_sp.AAC.1
MVIVAERGHFGPDPVFLLHGGDFLSDVLRGPKDGPSGASQKPTAPIQDRGGGVGGTALAVEPPAQINGR